MREKYVVFRWLSATKPGFLSPTSNRCLLLQTTEYDVNVHYWKALRLDRFALNGVGWFGYEFVYLRDRDSRGSLEVGRWAPCDRLIDRLIASKNRNQDLWDLQFDLAELFEADDCSVPILAESGVRTYQ